MRISDWSSDVCSSDLTLTFPDVRRYIFVDDFCGSGTQAVAYSKIVSALKAANPTLRISYYALFATSTGLSHARTPTQFDEIRSEERRVGKECVSTCRSRWSPMH